MSNLCRQKEENLHHDSLNLQFNIAVVDSMYKKASM